MPPRRKNPDTDRALAQVDRDRLLEGEDPSSRYVEDAAHWIAVYSELVMFKERLVNAAEQGIKDLTEPLARSEGVEIDLPVLLSERDRLRKRLDFWKERRRDLSGGD